MSEEFKVGDVVRPSNTEQDCEVLEVITLVESSPGPLLRVNLLGAKPPKIAYLPEHSVLLVRRAEDAETKKAAHDKKPEEKKADHATPHATPKRS